VLPRQADQPAFTALAEDDHPSEAVGDQVNEFVIRRRCELAAPFHLLGRIEAVQEELSAGRAACIAAAGCMD